MLSRLTPLRLVLLLPLSLSLITNCRGGGRGIPSVCRSHADCLDPNAALCSGGVCVGCFRDEDCNCHQVCENASCVALGAADLSRASNAHGIWEGTPGTVGYGHTGFCSDEGDCDFGQLCNPFTAGCVPAVDFSQPCTESSRCDNGPLGETTACAVSLSLCLPVASCRSNHGCCGREGFVCDTAANLCRPTESECLPPDESILTSACPQGPTEPRFQDRCAPQRFCSPVGICVQCLCDFDCSPPGANTGLKCDLSTNLCQPLNFCTSAEQCNDPDQSCDTLLRTCQERCESDQDCALDEFCDPSDEVCRDEDLRPCPLDTQEPNDLLSVAAPLELPPSEGDPRTYELSLCPGDVDWFTLDLQVGDWITLDGSSQTVDADISVFNLDGSTLIDTASFLSRTEFIAYQNGPYPVSVVADPIFGEPGTYTLSITRSTASPCNDGFEDGPDNDRNDIPSAATLLFSDLNGNVPQGCTLDDSGGIRSIRCTDIMALCPGDNDFFALRVPEGDGLNLTLSNFALEPELSLWGPFDSISEAAERPEALIERAVPVGLNPKTVSLPIARAVAYYVGKVSRPDLSSTLYDLVATLAPATPSCNEDSFDDLSSGGDGNSMPTPTFVRDAPGFNDRLESATGVALLMDQQIEISSAGGAPLSLCLQDQDWFELGTGDLAGPLQPLPENHRLDLELIPDAPPDGSFTLALWQQTTLIAGSANLSDPISQLVFTGTRATEATFLSVQGDNTSGERTYVLKATLIAPPPCDLDALGDTIGGRNDAPADAFLLDPNAPGAPPWPQAVGDVHAFNAQAPDTLSLCSDADWYRIAVPSDAQVLAWVRYDPLQSGVGLSLYDDSVATLSETTTLPPLTGLIATRPISGSSYQQARGSVSSNEAYILLHNRDGWPVSNYELGVQFLAQSCQDDPFESPLDNDDWTRATLLTPQDSVFGSAVQSVVLDGLSMCGDAEQDWYKVGLNAGDQLRTQVTYDPAVIDLDLFLKAPGPLGLNGELAQDLDNDDPSGVLEVTYTVPPEGPTGDHLLWLRPFGPTGQDYYYLETTVTRACVDDLLEPALVKRSPCTPLASPHHGRRPRFVQR